MAGPANKTGKSSVTQTDYNGTTEEELSAKVSASNMLTVVNQKNHTGIYY